MRILIALALSLFATNVLADEIRCYNYGRLIYHANVYNVTYSDDGFYIFIEAKTNKAVILSGDCVLKLRA